MLIKSQVKYIQSLGHKKFRDADGVFVAEGPKIVEELLKSDATRLVEAYATGDWLRDNQERVSHHQNIIEIGQRDLERISFLSTPSKVLAIFKKPVFPAISKPEGITLLLDNIQDPGNLGTMVRTADWFGAKQVICSLETADVFSPKVVQATMASLARVQVLYRELEELLRGHREVPVYAALLDGHDLREFQRVPQAFILIGNESRGIRPELQALATHRIRIPGSGSAESLNAAVAAGILLFLIQKT